MAGRLAISPSYLNLIERNQRPVSARVMMRLVEEFDLDPRSLREDKAIGGLDGLRRRFADERFADIAIDRAELQAFLENAPQAAAAFARLYDAADAPVSAAVSPLAETRQEIERWRNYFPELDEQAELLADEIRLSNADIGAGLVERLRERHRLTLRILPRTIIADTVRRLDLHARQVQLSEMLGAPARTFQVAMQIASLEARDTIGSIADGRDWSSDAARTLFERHLTAYFAAALVMPYGRLLRACEATGYDLAVLQYRFGVSYEQLAHRLTTLQRVGHRGLPFFMARIDRAGQFSKRYSGASGALLMEGEASCPLWSAHKAFDRAGILSQTVTFSTRGGGESQWRTFSRAVEVPGREDGTAFVVIVGVEAKLLADLAPGAQDFAEEQLPQTIGAGCARCDLLECGQRSVPPSGIALEPSRDGRSLLPFAFKP